LLTTSNKYRVKKKGGHNDKVGTLALSQNESRGPVSQEGWPSPGLFVHIYDNCTNKLLAEIWSLEDI
jgi:hypothetical protein